MDDSYLERFLELHKSRMAEKGVSSTFLSAEAFFRRLIARGSRERGPIAMIAERDRHMIGLLCFLRWETPSRTTRLDGVPSGDPSNSGGCCSTNRSRARERTAFGRWTCFAGMRSTSIDSAPSIGGTKRGSSPEGCPVQSSSSSCRPIGSRRVECGGRGSPRKYRDGPWWIPGRDPLARTSGTEAAWCRTIVEDLPALHAVGHRAIPRGNRSITEDVRDRAGNEAMSLTVDQRDIPDSGKRVNRIGERALRERLDGRRGLVRKLRGS